MNAALRRHLAPFLPMQVVFETPKRSSFAIHRFKGLSGAFKLLWFYRRNPQLIKAEEAYNQAMTAHSIGRFTQAEERYNQCLKLQPDHEPALTNLAALYLERNSEALAVETLKKALAIRPFFYRGYYNLGLVYRETGRTDEALAMFDQGLSYNESHFPSYAMIAEIHVTRNDLPRAIACYRKALNHCGNPHALYLRLAELYLTTLEFGAAEQCLRDALELKELPELHYNLGWLLAHQWREPELLVECFAKARRAKLDFKEAALNLALCQAAAGQAEQAVASMTRYLSEAGLRQPENVLKHLNFLREIDPANQAAALKVAELYIETEQVQRAIEVLSELLESNLALAPAIQMLAELYRNLGRHKDALNTFRRLVEVAPQELAGYLGLARCFGDIENYAAATPVLKKVLELDPNNTEVNYQYATLLAQGGNLSLALKHYKQVATLDPNYPRIQKRLRMLEEELEDQEAETPQAWPKSRSAQANLIARENAEHEDGR